MLSALGFWYARIKEGFLKSDLQISDFTEILDIAIEVVVVDINPFEAELAHELDSKLIENVDIAKLRVWRSQDRNRRLMKSGEKQSSLD